VASLSRKNSSEPVLTRVSGLRWEPTPCICRKGRKGYHTSTGELLWTEVCPHPQNPYADALAPI